MKITQSVFEKVRDALKYRELLRNLVVRDLKVRYKRSVLGFLWVMLNPLLMLLVLDAVFSGVFRISTKNYTAYLLSGIVLWNFFSQSTGTALQSFVGNANLIKKLYIPKYIFPLSVVISAVINLLFSILPLFAIFFLAGTSLSRLVYLLPLVIVLVALFSFGVALMVSTLTVFFHDTQYVYEVILLAWMYVTPIFYPASIVPKKYALFLTLNPLYYYLKLFRSVLYAESTSLMSQLWPALLFCFAALSLGAFFYGRARDRMVFHL